MSRQLFLSLFTLQLKRGANHRPREPGRFGAFFSHRYIVSLGNNYRPLQPEKSPKTAVFALISPIFIVRHQTAIKSGRAGSGHHACIVG